MLAEKVKTRKGRKVANKKAKKVSCTFTLSPDTQTYLGEKDNASAYVDNLIQEDKAKEKRVLTMKEIYSSLDGYVVTPEESQEMEEIIRNLRN